MTPPSKPDWSAEREAGKVFATRERRIRAAAPTLLAALIECYEYLDAIPESAVGGDDVAVALARKARAAIKEATTDPPP